MMSYQKNVKSETVMARILILGTLQHSLENQHGELDILESCCYKCHTSEITIRCLSGETEKTLH